MSDRENTGTPDPFIYIALKTGNKAVQSAERDGDDNIKGPDASPSGMRSSSGPVCCYTPPGGDRNLKSIKNPWVHPTDETSGCRDAYSSFLVRS